MNYVAANYISRTELLLLAQRFPVTAKQIRKYAIRLALGREIMQLLVVNVPPEASRDIAHAARLLALFGWALKCEARGECASFRSIASVLNPKAHGWSGAG